MEPAAVVKRGLIKLLGDFTSAGAELNNYIEAYGGTPLSKPTESLQDFIGFARYIGRAI